MANMYPYMNHEGGMAEEVDGADGAGDTLSRKDEILLDSVLQWYNQERSRVKSFSDIVNHKNGLSLRIIDWLITNFSKAFSVAIESDGLPRNLRRDYHKNLSAHNKKNFDPFARRRRIRIVLFGEEKRVSTIGQLNFFRWFLSRNLVGFLLENKAVIEKHMKESENKASLVIVDSSSSASSSSKYGCVDSKTKRSNHKRPPLTALERNLKTLRTEVSVVEPQVYSGTFKMSF